MKCFVCGGDMNFYFEKQFNMENLGQCEYVKCDRCDMVVSKTHLEMSKEKWMRLNYTCHSQYQGLDSVDADPQWIPRLEKQAEIIAKLYQNNILSSEDFAVDYGCGDGKLVDMINGIICKTGGGGEVLGYDKYMKKYHLLEDEINDRDFQLVINCSVFEHLLGMNDINNIFKLVNKKRGIFALHTLVCEQIPCDPDWFYLLPVHCTFYSNKAMQLLFSKFEFKACFYNLEARMWFFFYDEMMIERLKNIVDQLPGKWFYSKQFIDYWKEKPYRC